MQYRYAPAKDYTDYGSGLVLRSAPGHPGFPIRLGSELFQRAASHLPRRPLTVWDPFCGSGQLITTIGLLHRDRVGTLVASDVDPAAAELAGRNLSLVTAAGLRERRRELAEMAEQFGKASHATAVDAADRLLGTFDGGSDPVVRTGCADVFDQQALSGVVAGVDVDVVISDLPYGQQTHLAGNSASEDGLATAMAAVGTVVPPHAVMVVVAAGRRLPPLPGLERIEVLRIGTRVAGLFRPQSR